MTERPPSERLFSRSGHLLDATLEHVVFDELDDEGLARIRAHLGECGACAHRLDAVRQSEDRLSSALPGHLSAARSMHALPEPANIRRPWAAWTAGGAAVLAAVAGALLWVGSGGVDPMPGVRTKGAPLALEAFADDDVETWQLVDGDQVDPSWRVGFRVVSAEAGHLWMVGVDAEREPYRVHPTDGQHPVWFEAEVDEPPVLTAAVRFDTKPGMERVISLLCEVEMPYEVVIDELVVVAEATPDGQRLPLLFPSCLQSEIRLHKPEDP